MFSTSSLLDSSSSFHMNHNKDHYENGIPRLKEFISSAATTATTTPSPLSQFMTLQNLTWPLPIGVNVSSLGVHTHVDDGTNTTTTTNSPNKKRPNDASSFLVDDDDLVEDVDDILEMANEILDDTSNDAILLLQNWNTQVLGSTQEGNEVEGKDDAHEEEKEDAWEIGTTSRKKKAKYNHHPHNHLDSYHLLFPIPFQGDQMGGAAAAAAAASSTVVGGGMLGCTPPQATTDSGMSLLLHGKRHATPVLDNESTKSLSALEREEDSVANLLDGISDEFVTSLEDNVPEERQELDEDEEQSVTTTLKNYPRDASCDVESRYRDYQARVWYERLEELKEFHRTYGHCHVPHKWAENKKLAQWVKRQRYQYKLFHATGKHSAMSKERIDTLNGMGFVWDSHKASWEGKFVQLQAYKLEYGTTNVTMSKDCTLEHRELSVWLKCQRHAKKLYDRGAKSTITIERINKLNSIGFDWNPRNL